MSQIAELRAAGREPAVPCELNLNGGQRLRVTRWIRVLPAKRLVGLGELDGRAVLVKLFIAPAAERHFGRELRGIEALQAAALCTPAVVSSGPLSEGGNYLLTEFLGDAPSLAQLWDELDDSSPASDCAKELLALALATIGAMHAKGLQQADLHLGNFLRQGAQIFIIDGDAVQVQKLNEPLESHAAHANLALFFAQLPAAWDAEMELLLIHYLSANSRVIDSDGLARQVRLLRQQRLDDYLSKSLRDCTSFSVSQSWSRYSVCRRGAVAALGPLLEDPDLAFKADSLLKDGGSSTVARIDQNGWHLVVKRYNIKGIGHWLSRFWRPTRAWHSWLAAHRLQFLGIATPQPVAMVEKRFGPLRHKAWLVTEYQPGVDLLEHLGEGRDLPPEATLNEIRRVFVQLAEARITHGDCKGTNLLWHDDKIFLIDLDAMQAWRSDDRWAAAWEKDRARFLRNWAKDTPLHHWLEKHLPAVKGG